MEYAKYLLKEKENEVEAGRIAKANFFMGQFNVSAFSIIIDDSNEDGVAKTRYIDYMEEFMDGHATLVEFDTHRENLLSSIFTSVSIGMAFDENKAVVVDLFSVKECVVDTIDIREDTSTIILTGRMLLTKNGVFALRIMKVDENGNLKELVAINCQQISFNKNTLKFSATFKNAQKVFNESGKKYVDIYLREKPDTIKYE